MAKPLTYADAGLNLETYAATMAGIGPLLARTYDCTRVILPRFQEAGGTRLTLPARHRGILAEFSVLA